MSPTNTQRLVDQVGSAPIEIVQGYRDATPLIRAAGTVVSMAGYNSVCEALKAQTKALIVPRKGPSAEQRMRTEIFADRRLIAALDPFELSVDTMAPALQKLLEEDVIPEAANIPSFDGAARTATYLLEGVGDERAPAFAGPIVA
jgi:predicted glycosyltransferase